VDGRGGGAAAGGVPGAFRRRDQPMTSNSFLADIARIARCSTEPARRDLGGVLAVFWCRRSRRVSRAAS
jgi:hypothetical protein